MLSVTNIPHPFLNTPGTSQDERLPAKLDPDTMEMDGRSTADFLSLINRFSNLVNYYNANLERGNWQSFFNKSLPMLLARMHHFDVDGLEDDLEQLVQQLEQSPSKAKLKLLFDFIWQELIEPLYDLQNQFTQSNSGLARELNQLIINNLQEPILAYIGLSNGANKWYCIGIRDFFPLTSQSAWGLDLPDLYIIDEDFRNTPGTIQDRMMALSYQLTNSIEPFFQVFRQITQNASSFLEDELDTVVEGQRLQQPHLALLFAFLELYRKLQDNFNNLTTRHLQFYYEEILGIQRRDLTPDQAHIIFNLQKHILQKEVKAGTVLKNGKDLNKKDILYQLVEDVVFDKTQIAEVRTLYLQPTEGYTDNNSDSCDADDKDRYVEGVYITSDATKADGIEEDLEEGESWSTLGAKDSKFYPATTPASLDLTPALHPNARLGFVLASPVLLLNEGERKITITLDCSLKNLDCSLKNLDCIESVQIADFTTQKFSAILPSLFDLQFSGEADWFSPSTVSVSISNSLQLEFVIELSPDEPAVTFADSEILKEDFQTQMPLLKIQLINEQKIACVSDNYKPCCDLERCCPANDELMVSAYHFLRHLQVTDSCIEVEVCGVKNLIVQNEENLQSVNSLMYPFGARPTVGTSFYVGSKEVFCKNWKEFKVNVEWKDRPDVFNDYYSAYNDLVDTSDPYEDGSTEIFDSSFEITPNILHDGSWQTLGSNPKLFEEKDTLLFCPSPSNFNTDKRYNAYGFNRGTLSYEDNSMPLEPLESLDVNSNKGFVELKLDGVSFQHHRYAFVLASQMFKLSGVADLVKANQFSTKIQEACQKAQTNHLKVDTVDGIINAIGLGNPVTAALIDEFIDTILFKGLPTVADELEDLVCGLETDLNNITGDSLPQIPREPYTPIIKNISIDYKAKSEDTEIHFLHLYPFEQTNKIEEITNTPTLFPTFTDEGTLFIGLKQLKPGNMVNMLFQLAEATANSELNKANLKWHYLSRNQWYELQEGFHIIEDNTNYLTRSGIVKINIPRNITKDDNTIMPNGLHWLKVSAFKNVAAVGETIGIHTQAALVEYTPQSENLRESMLSEKGSISKMKESDSTIKGVTQFYDSFGGRNPEEGNTLYRRISERLRHKGRAVNQFDYERLVLERFNEIYRVKCISHTFGLSATNYQRDLEMAPGFVLLAVIPDVNQLQAGARALPRVPVSLLDSITKYVKERTTPFLRLKVRNPRYEEVHIRVGVQLHQGRSIAYYSELLAQEIKQFLAPWQNGDLAALQFGRILSRSELVYFIETRPYVDYVCSLYWLHEDKKEGTPDCKLPIDVNNCDEPSYLFAQYQTEEIYPTTARSILVAGDVQICDANRPCEEFSDKGTPCINNTYNADCTPKKKLIFPQ